MQIDILTPSYNQHDELERCIHSVRCQRLSDSRNSLLHHVQNGGDHHDYAASLMEGTDKSDVTQYRFQYTHEPDNGMYDALNRAYASTAGDIIGHLNSDEQYLPGTLEYIAERFRRDPDLTVLTGGVVVTDPDGKYLCSRIPVPVSKWHTQVSHLALFTAATFYRRSLIESLETYFNTSYQAAGDVDLILRILRRKERITICKRYLSTFSDSGENLALSETALREQDKIRSNAPFPVAHMKFLVESLHRMKKWTHGAYSLKPFSYSYIDHELLTKTIRVEKPRAIWKERL